MDPSMKTMLLKFLEIGYEKNKAKTTENEKTGERSLKGWLVCAVAFCHTPLFILNPALMLERVKTVRHLSLHKVMAVRKLG
jgi:hypothetical protein